MNYDIRNISVYFHDIHSRYYIDTNGCVYTSLSPQLKKIMVDGERITVTSFIKNHISELNKTDKQIMRFPFSKDYYLMYDGTILQRLKTKVTDNNRAIVHLVCVEKQKQLEVSRLVAGVFIGSVEGKEVHHKDQNRLNNHVDNLQILTFEEHRGKGHFKDNHNL